MKESRTESRWKKEAGVLALAGLSLAMALVPAGASFAAQVNYNYNCSSYSGFKLGSYATSGVTHYHNGSAVGSWYQTSPAWRYTYHPPTAAVASITAQTITNRSGYCYLNA